MHEYDYSICNYKHPITKPCISTIIVTMLRTIPNPKQIANQSQAPLHAQSTATSSKMGSESDYSTHSAQYHTNHFASSGYTQSSAIPTFIAAPPTTHSPSAQQQWAPSAAKLPPTTSISKQSPPHEKRPPQRSQEEPIPTVD